MSKCREDGLCQKAIEIGMAWAHCVPGACPFDDRPQHANPPADAVPCGTHPDNDGLDDYRNASRCCGSCPAGCVLGCKQ